MVDLVISIVNTNNKDILRTCMESILKNTHGITYKLCVLDNCSEDGSAEMVKNEFPQVSLMINEKRESYARNHNRVYKKNPEGKYFLMLNEDIIVQDNAFYRMFEFMEANPEIGLLGCKLTYPDGTTQKSIARYPSLFEVFTRFGQRIKPLANFKLISKYSVKNWNYDKSCELINCYPMGSCSMIRKETIEKVGLMDERFAPIYLEEVDWCYRIWKAGYKLYYLADVTIIHYHGYTIKKSNPEFRNTIRAAFYRNRRYYFQKHCGIFSYYGLLVHNLFGAIGGLLFWQIYPLIKNVPRSDVQAHINQYKRYLSDIFTDIGK